MARWPLHRSHVPTSQICRGVSQRPKELTSRNGSFEKRLTRLVTVSPQAFGYGLELSVSWPSREASGSSRGGFRTRPSYSRQALLSRGGSDEHESAHFPPYSPFIRGYYAAGSYRYISGPFPCCEWPRGHHTRRSNLKRRRSRFRERLLQNELEYRYTVWERGRGSQILPGSLFEDRLPGGGSPLRTGRTYDDACGCGGLFGLRSEASHTTAHSQRGPSGRVPCGTDGSRRAGQTPGWRSTIHRRRVGRSILRSENFRC